MDFYGNGILIEKRRLNEVLSIQNSFYSFEKFRYMCILSGCDYLPSLPGIGLVKACKVLKTARQQDLRQLLKKLPTYLKMNLAVTDEYVEKFICADNTFLYQLVFDPLQRKMIPLNPYAPEVDTSQLDYAGRYPLPLLACS
ncbi:exonuclease 1 [Elysia marginata]|uniref:Exonuclease 1 n=1 Tax=Elysia marginata TaxID=1093978 RepID=A0AAV4HCE1_9GAST|nr:exonuclease 1 [Elysia marginata]